MSQSAWQDKKNREQSHQKKIRWELFVLAAICIALGGGFLLFKPSSGKGESLEKPSASALSQFIEQSETSSVARSIPANYETKGTVDNRYTLAQDPKSGQFVLNDSMGGLGTNNTSIDGDRARLAEEMVELEEYAEENRSKLSSAAYNWLKKVARLGMQLAFGAPGMPAYAQPEIKQEILAALHSISANPESSVMTSDKYMELDKLLLRLEAAYLANGDVDNSNYFSYDPLYSPSQISNLALQGYRLSSLLSSTNLYPTADRLASADSPYTYTVYNTSTLTASTSTSPTPSTTTLSPTYSISRLSPSYSTTLASPTYSTSSTNTLSRPTVSTSTSTSTSSTSTSDSTSTSTDESVTVAEYYDSVLGTKLSKSSLKTVSGTTSGSTLTTSPTTVSTTTSEPTLITTSPTVTSVSTTSAPTSPLLSPVLSSPLLAPVTEITEPITSPLLH
jgi:hypothetical protein